MDMELTGKVALVTGASRGLGRATSESLLAEGVKLLAVARPSDELSALQARYPDQCKILAGDLLDPALPAQAVQAALTHFGRLDIVLVNPPGPRSVMPLQATESDFITAFDTTFYPALRLIRAAHTALQAQQGGRILIVSSTSVKAPKPFLCLSAAARSALWAWAKSAAPELYQSGITLNALFVGPHDTARARDLGIQGQAMGKAEDFGRFVTSLCSPATQFVTGTGFIMDGGELTGI